MNLLGKILTFAILIAALLALIGAMVVYSTHRNWKEDADNLSQQLDDAKNENQQLQSSLRSLESQLTAELESAKREVIKLETERDRLDKENIGFEDELEKLDLALRQNTEALKVTQDNNETLAGQVTTLRQEVRASQQQRDVSLANTIEATDLKNQTLGELAALNERHTQLVQELSTKTALLRENGIDPNTDLEAIVPSVRGVVSKMHRSAGSQLIEITVGADDGLKPGHTIEVFRGERYLGRAEILRTEPDRAVGRVIRRFQLGPIQEGDDVATRLRIG